MIINSVQKGGQNKTHVWSEIDQQLWLTIFTVALSTLKEEYPFFYLMVRQVILWSLIVWG